MEENKKILVFGGTGHYGQRIVKSLLAKKVEVRVLTRNPDKAQTLFGNSVEVVFGDVLSKNCIINSLKDVSGVVISLSAINPKQIRQMKRIELYAVISIIEKMEILGIDRLVFISVYDLRIELLKRLKIMKLGEIKLAVEKRIRESKLNWTILGCPPSFEIFFSLLRGTRLIAPGGCKNRIACQSPDDLGEVASQAILRNDLGGKRFRMAGPEAVNFPEVAKRMSVYSGKKIKLFTPPLLLFNVISWIVKPFNPFIRFIYYSLKLMNNFPEDLAEQVPGDHQLLLAEFDYQPKSLDDEIAITFR